MPSLLDHGEAVAVVDRILRGMVDDEHEAAWIDLVERSLGIRPGRLHWTIGEREDDDAAAILARAARDDAD